jgi:heme exporter protein A
VSARGLPPAGTGFDNTTHARLAVEGLACTRGHATLFRDVGFQIDAGEWLAVRGPNGSGKTTLLRCVAGLTRADRGTVTWNGQATREDRSAFNAQLLYAGHLAGIKDDLSAEENLEGALRLRGHAPDGAAIRTALTEVGLEKRRLLPARRLSAGQRRRIGLARLMLDPAACWILDEPLTALDDDGQALFSRLLREHLDKGGLALVATHHDLSLPRTREWRFS